jgi:hypothetical protein
MKAIAFLLVRLLLGRKNEKEEEEEVDLFVYKCFEVKRLLLLFRVALSCRLLGWICMRSSGNLFSNICSNGLLIFDEIQ